MCCGNNEGLEPCKHKERYTNKSCFVGQRSLTDLIKNAPLAKGEMVSTSIVKAYAQVVCLLVERLATAVNREAQTQVKAMFIAIQNRIFSDVASRQANLRHFKCGSEWHKRNDNHA